MAKRRKRETETEVVVIEAESLRPFIRALLATAEEILKRQDEERKRLQEMHRPDDLRVLFVNESPPPTKCSGS